MRDLLEGIPARSSDPETSHEAARAIARKRTDLQMRVLAKFGGGSELSDIDLQNLFGDHGSTYRTRAQELTGLGLLHVVGFKMQRGARRQVRQITARGEAVLKAMGGH